MRREQLEELIGEAARASGNAELVVIGSQAVHATTNDIPAEVVMSLECDLLLEGDAAARVHKALGPTSAYHAAHGTYADVVAPEFPFLPRGWETRLRSLDVANVASKCLEVHDLAVSKLAAGRLKDYELVAALIARKIITPDVVRERVALSEDLRMRAILLARLQIVLESIG